MEIQLSSSIIKNLGKPTFPINISSSTNKIFIKYSESKIRRNHIDIIYNLCKNSNFKNKESLLYQTLIFHDLILYNCGNEDIIKDINLMILTSFFISIKSIGRQINLITIEQLKKLNNEFLKYKNEQIVNMEILCIKLLKYNINVLTCYDCLKIILLNHFVDDNFSENAKDLLQTIIFGDIEEYIFKLPYKLALEVFEKIKIKFKNLNSNNKVLENNKKNNISLLGSNGKTNVLKTYLKYSQKNNFNYNDNDNDEFSLINSNDFSTNQNLTSFYSNQKSLNNNNLNKNNIQLNVRKSNTLNRMLMETCVYEFKQKNELDKKKEEKNNNNNNISENKSLIENNNYYNLDSIGKGQLNLDFKYLSIISKKLKLNSLKKKPETNSFMG